LNIESQNRPIKTNTDPSHCSWVNLFPNSSTEPKTVKNFLVVVTIEHGSGPKSVTIIKMKNWPNAEATEKLMNLKRMSGFRPTKVIKANSSQVIRSAIKR